MQGLFTRTWKSQAIVERWLILGFTTLLPSLNTDQYFFIIVEIEKDATTVPWTCHFKVKIVIWSEVAF